MSLIRLAFRYCFWSNSGVPLTTLLSIGGMAIGVASLVVAMAVMSGFETTLQKTVIDVSGHLLVLKRGTEDQAKALEEVKPFINGFEAATPFIFLEAVLAKKGVVSGVGVEGVHPEKIHQVLRLQKRLVKGELDFSEREGEPPGIVIGKGIQKRFDVKVGEVLRLVIPVVSSRDYSKFKPRLRKFKVRGVVSFGHHEFDSRYILMNIKAAQNFASVGDRVSGYKIRVKDDAEALAAGLAILEKFGTEYFVKDWKDGNRNLFEAVDLERMIVFFVLLIIVIVACFNISGALFISVVRRYKDISILKAMGARDAFIMRIFTLQGLTLGFLGSFLGILLGLLICYGLIVYQQQYSLISSEVYQLDKIELSYRFFDFVLIFAASLGICFVATLVPAIRGAGLNPVEGLRYD
ncbi:MAG: ABC transporter permease [Bdellovibrionales bacterium]|nr:ABC transporter permease [Bdellovibrionales bacterium]